jgi:valyl-tRNA synthetase
MLDSVLSSPHISKRDQFILSKLNTAIIDVNKELNAYQFGTAVSVLHTFFLYDVCDLYLELIKPIMYDASEENKNKKYCAQVTLYTVIEQFLRLCHPFMPFVTEELWQRLPNRKLLITSESIMIAKYPQPVANMTNESAEKDMDFIKDLIHGARSLRVDYKIANQVKANYYFKADLKEKQEIIINQIDDFCNLAKANFLTHLPADADIPKGCCLKVLSEHLTLLVDLTGLIDIDQELIRLSKDKERLIPSIEQYKKKIASHNDKIPENVQQQNNEKLISLEGEYAAVIEAIASFEKMKMN